MGSFRLLRALAALAVVAGGALAAPITIDMTTAGTVDNTLTDAILRSLDDTTSVGTGSIYSFLRIQATGNETTEQGYNTDKREDASPKVQFDQLTDPNFTRSITLGQIPIVTIDGVEYRQFLLDLNEPSATVDDKYLITMYELAFYVESVGNLDNWPTAFSSPVWQMNDPIQASTSTGGADDYDVKMDATNTQGSGNRFDLVVNIKSSLFGSDNSKNIYLYSRFGVPYTVEGTFEEWAVREAVDGTVPIPEPGTLALLGAGVLGLFVLRRRRNA